MRHLKVVFTALAFFSYPTIGFTAPAQAQAVKLDWIELMPAHLLEKLESLPMLEHDYSDEAVDPFTDEWEDPYADTWNEILTSTEVVDQYEGQLVKLPGFIVPLDIDNQQRVESFFLVPYFGACIHVPPPPPNQLIHVAKVPAETSLSLGNMYSAFWITGYLHIETTSHELGIAAYSLKVTDISPYTY